MATRPPKSSAAAAPAPAPAAAVDDVEDILTVPGVANDDRDMIWLWRLNAGAWDFLEPVGPAALRALGIRETVRQRYGGGTFKARLRSRGGQWGVSRQFAIEGEPRAATREAEAPAAAAAAPAGATLPDWVKSIVMPIAVTLGTTLAKRLLDPPPPPPALDPTLLKLLVDRPPRAAATESIDVLKMTELLRQAEDRGERRGRELGELVAGGQGEGVAGVVGQVIPVMNRMLDRRDAEQGPDTPAPRRPVLSGPAEPDPRALQETDVTQTPAAARSDIVPAWLRPFLRFKSFVIEAADSGRGALPIAGMVIENASDEAWSAIAAADEAHRLESDIFAAMPELQQSEARRAFVGQIVQELRNALQSNDDDAAQA